MTINLTSPLSIVSSETQCNICLEPNTNKSIVAPCSHSYHPICLEQWIKSDQGNYDKCPTCRANLVAIDIMRPWRNKPSQELEPLLVQGQREIVVQVLAEDWRRIRSPRREAREQEREQVDSNVRRYTYISVVGFIFYVGIVILKCIGKPFSGSGLAR